MTIREALGSPASPQWIVFFWLTPVVILLVILQEAVTPFPSWWWPLLSALAQHLVAGVVVAIGDRIARRRHDIVPVITVLLMWMLAAACRGIVGGAVAESVAGVNPDYVLRIAVWVLISAVWLVPMVFAVAQFRRRRSLIAALDSAHYEQTQEQLLSDVSGAEMQRQLRKAIAESLDPALRQLQASLATSRGLLKPGAVAELSLRISQLDDDAADLSESARAPLVALPPARARLSRIIDVAPRQPGLSAVFVWFATIALLLVDTWRIFGPLAALEVVVSTSAAAAVLAVLPAAVRALRPAIFARRAQRVSVAATTLAIGVGAYLMLNSGIDPLTWHSAYLLPLLVTGLVAASATYFLAIGLADANREGGEQLSALDADLGHLRTRNLDLLERERRRMTDLMHGPVQGRIAACVMALNFHVASQQASDQHPADQHPFDAEPVLEHLRAVSRDLSVITASVSRARP